MTIITTPEASKNGGDRSGVVDIDAKSGHSEEGTSKKVGGRISSKSNKAKRKKRKNNKDNDPNGSNSVITIRRDELESLVRHLVKEGE